MSEKEEDGIEEPAEEPTEELNEGSTEDEQKEIKVPALWHNYISFGGIAVATAAIVSIILLFLIEFTGSSDQPYLGILIYIIGPAIMIFGFFIILAGMLFERFRRRKMSPEEIAAYPILDLNGPKRRRAFIVFLFASFVFLFISAFGSYQAFEFTESVTFCGEVCHSVMRPELVAYKAASHSNIKCVECHVGGGAEWYLRSKFAGVRQLWGVITDDYSKPIKTPVHNMRPANETCGKCHWPDKFYGDQLRVFDHYGYDEKNSLNQTRLLVKVGGGNPATGNATGIHWHMNLGNEITYVSADERRGDVVWVQMKTKDGKTIEYSNGDTRFTADQIAKAPRRKMDCIDCHNRPTHVYLSPSTAVDNSLSAGKIDKNLPFVKKKAVEVLSGNYTTTEQALKAISDDLNKYYSTSYADVYSSNRNGVNAAVVEVQRIYSTYFFPEMKTDWRAHDNNIGHFNAEGCFRCHNGSFTSKEGRTIRKDCSICHTTLDQTVDGKTFTPENGIFEHPVNLGDNKKLECAVCHKADRGFKHPVSLGDISKFQCAECHKTGYKKPQ